MQPQSFDLVLGQRGLRRGLDFWRRLKIQDIHWNYLKYYNQWLADLFLQKEPHQVESFLGTLNPVFLNYTLYMDM